MLMKKMKKKKMMMMMMMMMICERSGIAELHPFVASFEF